MSIRGKIKRKIKKLLGFRKVKTTNTIQNELKDKLYPVLSSQQKERLNKALKFSFTGDLILLRDMIETAWDESRQVYDFTPMFQYVKPIWEGSDLAMGVFEGVMAGEEISYSTSNFVDGIPLRLNFPDTYAEAIKEAGMDVVTLANNHLFDCGEKGLMRTLDVLDKKRLKHVGAYRTVAEKSEACFVTVKGLKIAILPFTYCPNNVTEEFFIQEPTSRYTHGLVPQNSPFFERIKENVILQLENAKKQNPDMIIALPHMGTQFSEKPDEMQIFWSRFLAQNGADIVFGCHSHHIQPIEWIDNDNKKKSLIVYCPGNFINSYTNRDGDLSMIINAYIDPDTKEIFAAGTIPIYASTNDKGQFVGVPFYTLVSSFNAKKKNISFREYKHISDLHLQFSKIVLKENVTIDQCQLEYYIFEQGGYFRNEVPNIDESSNSILYSLIAKANCVCFIGDAITEGTKNGGYGWFEPLMACFPQKSYIKFASGGKTSQYFVEHLDCFNNNGSDLYVMAIGCNDIRYRDPSVCAMDSMKFVENLDKIAQSIIKKNPQAQMVFVAPWWSAPFDPYCSVTFAEKKKLYAEYIDALEKLCQIKGFTYVNPNPYIGRITSNYRKTDMLKDYIHPDANNGIRL